MQAARHRRAEKASALPRGAIIWLLVSLAVFAALPGMMSGNYLPKIFWVVLTVGIGLALLAPRRGEGFSLSLLGGVWLTYLAWALLSLAWALQPRVALERWLVMLVLSLAYLLAGRTRFWESPLFWRGFSLIAGLAALIGILQYYLPSFAPANYFPGTAVPRGTMGHRNYAGMYFMVTLPFLARYYFSARGKEALLPFAALVLGMGFLLLGKTRGAWLGLAAGVVFFLIAGGGKKLARCRRRAAGLAGTFLAVIIFAVVVKPPGPVAKLMAGKADLIQTGKTVLDPRNRLEFWREVPLITNPLLGAGFGNFPIVATPPDREGKVKTLNWEVHNDYLQAYVDLGVPGAVLFLGVFIILILSAWRGRGRGLILAAGVSIVGLAVMQFTVFTMEVVSTQVWIAGVAAILNRPSPLRPITKIPWPARIALPVNYLLVLGLLLLALAIGFTIRGDREFRSVQGETEKVLAYRTALEKGEDYPEAVRHRLRRELEYARFRLQMRLNRLVDRILPTMFFDSNMRHISCHQFAGLAWSLNDHRLTEKFARPALNLHPYDRTALTYLAAITLQEGRLAEAARYLEKGFAIFGPNPYRPFFGENLARLCRARSDTFRAGEILEMMEANRVAAPRSPSPPSRTRAVPVDGRLAWEECRGAVVYDVYLWPEGEREFSPRAIATGLKDNRFRPGKDLLPETTYIWRVRARGRYGEKLSELWSFRTGPVQE